MLVAKSTDSFCRLAVVRPRLLLNFGCVLADIEAETAVPGGTLLSIFTVLGDALFSIFATDDSVVFDDAPASGQHYSY